MDDLKVSQLPIEAPAKRIDANFKPTNKAQLEKAAKEFEGMFMQIVMKSMRDTVSVGETEFGDSDKVKFFQSMLDEQYSKISSEKSGLGLAQAIVRQLGSRLESEQLAQQTPTQKPIQEAQGMTGAEGKKI